MKSRPVLQSTVSLSHEDSSHVDTPSRSLCGNASQMCSSQPRFVSSEWSCHKRRPPSFHRRTWIWMRAHTAPTLSRIQPRIRTLQSSSGGCLTHRYHRTLLSPIGRALGRHNQKKKGRHNQKKEREGRHNQKKGKRHNQKKSVSDTYCKIVLSYDG